MSQIGMSISGLNKNVKKFNEHLATCGFKTVDEMICSLSSPCLSKGLIETYQKKFDVTIRFSKSTQFCRCTVKTDDKVQKS